MQSSTYVRLPVAAPQNIQFHDDGLRQGGQIKLRAPNGQGRYGPSVDFHNFNLRIFNLRVSNPNKLIGCFFDTMSDFISMCQGLGPKKTMKFRKSTVSGKGKLASASSRQAVRTQQFPRKEQLYTVIININVTSHQTI